MEVRLLVPELSKHYKFVDLGHVVSQIVVLGEEGQHFCRGPVVGDSCWVQYALAPKHLLEKVFALAASLSRLMHVKVENAEWRYIFHLVFIIVGFDIELAGGDFKHGDNFLPLDFQVNSLLVGTPKEAICCRDSLLNVLRSGRGFAHIIDNCRQLISLTQMLLHHRHR